MQSLWEEVTMKSIQWLLSEFQEGPLVGPVAKFTVGHLALDFYYLDSDHYQDLV